jgi:hypothetical protein
MEKAEHGGAGGGSKIPPMGTSKAKTLAEAGISTSAAQRYEALAGPKEKQAEKAIEAATDAYFAKQQETKGHVTLNGLLGVAGIT